MLNVLGIHAYGTHVVIVLMHELVHFIVQDCIQAMAGDAIPKLADLAEG